MRKYSCSAPANEKTVAGLSWPNSVSTRCAWTLSACCERRSGVFLSSASPVHDTNAVGMHRVVPLGFSRM
jgi:hypothetical protein